MTLDDFRKMMTGIPSAWRGHEEFAVWLVNRVQPKVTVELGVNLGYSLFALASPGIGDVIGVDHFAGRTPQDTDDHTFVTSKLPLFPNVKLMVANFTDAGVWWENNDRRRVDILHIDGNHDYDSVKRDFNDWYRHTHPSSVILFHDTRSFPDGVGKFFDNAIMIPKCEFTHSCGLGVVGPAGLMREIHEKYPETELTIYDT